MSEKTAQLARSAGLISLATMLSRILGLVREQLIAHLFSRTATDAFYVAFRIPNLLRDLFAEGAMSSAFVPTFTDYLSKQKRKDAWLLASILTNVLLVLLSGITLAGILWSDWLVQKFAANFRSVPGKFELTVSLTQIMFPFLPMIALAALAMGILNSHGRFFVPALAPCMFNAGSLVVATTLYFWLPKYHIEPVVGMAIGTLFGGLLQLLIQLPSLLKQGFNYSLKLSFTHPGVKRVLFLMGPGTIGLAATQVNIFVNTWLATSQQEGAVSWLNYAFRLMQFPIGVFGVAIATASLPVISTHVSRNESEELKATLSSSLRMVFTVNLPASLGLIFLARPIIGLIYEHGRFTSADTFATSKALIFYSVGLFAYSAVKVLVPVFYALGRSRVPVIASVTSIAANIALNLLLVRPFGYWGLAFGTSLTSILNFLLLFFWLRKYTGPLEGSILLGFFFKVLAASLVMGLSCSYFHQWLEASFPGMLVAAKALALFFSILFGLAILWCASKVLRISAYDSALRFVIKRFRV